MASKSEWVDIQNCTACSETGMSHIEKFAGDLKESFATRGD